MSNRMKRLGTTLTIGALLFVTGAADAQVCSEERTQEALQYLRRLSLDIRGRLPDMSELSSVATNGAVDPSMVTAMLDSEEAVTELREYHRALLWTNVTDQRLANAAWILRSGGRDSAPGAYWIRSNARSNGYRGAQVGCLDEPAQLDPTTGEIQTTFDEATQANREGWVMVAPYWAPNTQIKVCAFDAQENETGTDRRGRMIQCSRGLGRTCGCGPNLRWCQSDRGTAQAITRSFNEQLLRFTDAIYRGDRPYTDLLTANDMEVNGPIAHYFNYMTGTGANFLLSTPQQNYEMPQQLSFAEPDRWVAVDRGARHAGVLSMPAYLIKFQSDRGRANRFYNAFLCQHFEAPEGGLPAASDECHDEPDLTKRCGCQYCHAALEPAAAYWGRWAEAGVAPLNEDTFPEDNPACTTPQGALNPACRRLYLTQALHADEEPYVGKLLPYVFADDTRKENIRIGPRGIARDAIDSGAFASCTVNKMWQHYMSRDAVDSDAEAVAALTAQFKQGYSIRSLIQSIVNRPEYVKAGRFAGEKE